MSTIQKILMILLMTIFSNSLFAYSYAAAGKEPTIESREKILKFVNANDFIQAKNEFEKAKDNYAYLSNLHDKNLLNSLETAINNKQSLEINKWLNISLAAEINRRLDGGLKNIEIYNVSKVMLAKANKYYKLLEPSLTKEQKQKLSLAIKNCMKSIGNPGLFGVGAKPADLKKFKENQQTAIGILKSL